MIIPPSSPFIEMVTIAVGVDKQVAFTPPAVCVQHCSFLNNRLGDIFSHCYDHMTKIIFLIPIKTQR